MSGLTKTNIEYLDFTWNPIAMQCTPVSKGCAQCWHLKFADRLKANPKISEAERKAYAGGHPILLERKLVAPLHRKIPAVIGVQLMGDLFHDKICRACQILIFDVMKKCPQHTFIVLTKRSEAMKNFIKWYGDIPSNIWLGVSCENQQRAEERIPILYKVPAAVRCVSAEPLLGPIDFGFSFAYIDWVICGAESGPKRRLMRIEWAESIAKQCQAANIPFFYKQGPSENEHLEDVIKMPQLLGRTWSQMPAQDRQ